MNLLGKEVLIIGLGISGLSTIKALNNLGANISVMDSKNEEDLKDILTNIQDISIKKYFGTNIIDLNKVDLIVKSPGVPPNAEIIQKARKNNIEIITDIELAFRLSPTEKIITITGTNGKTTTTTLVGEILKRAKFNTYIVGNIGVGILQEIVKSKPEDVFVVEASSFQLEDIKQFRPKVSLILNISPDHLDWHGSYENYINAKKNIFKNQGENDYIILNYDDKIIRNFKKEISANIIWFSLLQKLSRGIYLDGEDIIINDGIRENQLMSITDIRILGKHNLENILGSIGICYAMGIDSEIIKQGIEDFKGVEHRLEYVTEKKGICFYNDSKGTNPEASIKAIEAISTPIILIAGGYDKGVSFENFIKSFENKVKSLILLGETKEQIKNTAIEYGFQNYYLVDNMDEAVGLGYKLGRKGDSVLLSPACASWECIRILKKEVRNLKKLFIV